MMFQPLGLPILLYTHPFYKTTTFEHFSSHVLSSHFIVSNHTDRPDHRQESTYF
jgi:hypothetical protein